MISAAVQVQEELLCCLHSHFHALAGDTSFFQAPFGRRTADTTQADGNPNKLPIITQQSMIYISRQEHFNAAHKLYNPKWSEERNREVFGPCANTNWHGHNFDLIVTVKGKPDPDTGFVIDLKQLSTLIRTHIIDQVDHKNLNLDVPFMEGQMASTENLAMAFWKILQPEIERISPARLHSIKLYETPRNFVEYLGE